MEKKKTTIGGAVTLSVGISRENTKCCVCVSTKSSVFIYFKQLFFIFHYFAALFAIIMFNALFTITSLLALSRLLTSASYNGTFLVKPNVLPSFPSCCCFIFCFVTEDWDKFELDFDAELASQTQHAFLERLALVDTIESAMLAKLKFEMNSDSFNAHIAQREQLRTTTGQLRTQLKNLSAETLNQVHIMCLRLQRVLFESHQQQQKPTGTPANPKSRSSSSNLVNMTMDAAAGLSLTAFAMRQSQATYKRHLATLAHLKRNLNETLALRATCDERTVTLAQCVQLVDSLKEALAECEHKAVLAINTAILDLELLYLTGQTKRVAGNVISCFSIC